MKIIIIAVFLLCLTQAQEPEEIIYQEEVVQPIIMPTAEPVPEPTPITMPQPEVLTPRQPFKFDLDTVKIYQNQVLAILGIFIYLLVYLKGKKENIKLMQRFYRKVARCLEANFAHIGFSKTSEEALFNGESPSESTYYATGRDNVDGIEMRFSTKKRQDLIYRIIDIFMPDKDTVTIDIPVRSEVPLVLAIAHKKQIKALTEKNPDIKTMTKQFKVGSSMPQNYEVLGEAADTVDSIIDKYVVKKINDCNGLILSVHYTDMQIYSQSSGHLRVVINLNHKNDETFLPGLQLILYLADKIANLKISAASKVKALKSREVYHQSKEKQDLQKHKDDLKKRKEQKLRKQEAWLRSLPPEKQKRQEEKRKKKEFNKIIKGGKMKA